jgi:hypothetical protein
VKRAELVAYLAKQIEELTALADSVAEGRVSPAEVDRQFAGVVAECGEALLLVCEPSDSLWPLLQRIVRHGIAFAGCVSAGECREWASVLERRCPPDE